MMLGNGDMSQNTRFPLFWSYSHGSKKQVYVLLGGAYLIAVATFLYRSLTCSWAQVALPAEDRRWSSCKGRYGTYFQENFHLADID